MAAHVTTSRGRSFRGERHRRLSRRRPRPHRCGLARAGEQRSGARRGHRPVPDGGVGRTGSRATPSTTAALRSHRLPARARDGGGQHPPWATRVGVSALYGGGDDVRIRGTRSGKRDRVQPRGGQDPVLAGNVLCGNAEDVRALPASREIPAVDSARRAGRRPLSERLSVSISEGGVDATAQPDLSGRSMRRAAAGRGSPVDPCRRVAATCGRPTAPELYLRAHPTSATLAVLDIRRPVGCPGSRRIVPGREAGQLLSGLLGGIVGGVGYVVHRGRPARHHRHRSDVVRRPMMAPLGVVLAPLFWWLAGAAVGTLAWIVLAERRLPDRPRLRLQSRLGPSRRSPPPSSATSAWGGRYGPTWTSDPGTTRT